VLRRNAGILPERGEVSREVQQFSFLLAGERALAALLQGREFSLRLSFIRHCLVPAAFEFRDHEPVRRIPFGQNTGLMGRSAIIGRLYEE
jgi:hypothetical protein